MERVSRTVAFGSQLGSGWLEVGTLLGLHHILGLWDEDALGYLQANPLVYWWCRTYA